MQNHAAEDSGAASDLYLRCEEQSLALRESAGLLERAGASGPDPAAFVLAKHSLNPGV